MSKYNSTRLSKGQQKLPASEDKAENVPLSLRVDLPEEARSLLYTVDTLPKGGGLETSRWASEEDIISIKADREAGGYEAYHKKLQEAYRQQEEFATSNSIHASEKPPSTPYLSPSISRSNSVIHTSGLSPSPFLHAEVPSGVSAEVKTTSAIKTGELLKSDYILPHMRKLSSAQPVSADRSAAMVPSSTSIPPHLRPQDAKITNMVGATSYSPGTLSYSQAAASSRSSERFSKPAHVAGDTKATSVAQSICGTKSNLSMTQSYASALSPPTALQKMQSSSLDETAEMAKPVQPHLRKGSGVGMTLMTKPNESLKQPVPPHLRTINADRTHKVPTRDSSIGNIARNPSNPRTAAVITDASVFVPTGISYSHLPQKKPHEVEQVIQFPPQEIVPPHLPTPASIQTSPMSSPAGSSTQILPFFRKKIAVASPLSKVQTTSMDQSKSATMTVGSASADLPPHLRRAALTQPNSSSRIVADQHNKFISAEKMNLTHQTSIKDSNLGTKPMYVPPHLRNMSMSAQSPWDSDQARSGTNQSMSSGVRIRPASHNTKPSVPGYHNKDSNGNTTEISSNTPGGVALARGWEELSGAKVENKADKTEPITSQMAAHSTRADEGEDDESSIGWGLPSAPLPYVDPLVHSDPTIKTHSTEKFGSDWDEWKCQRKSGPLKSLCVSDNGVVEDATENKRIGKWLASHPHDSNCYLDTLQLTYEQKQQNDWMNDRPEVTNAFVTEFVKVWRREGQKELVVVDTKASRFKRGNPINIGSIMDPIKQPETVPDYNAVNDKVKFRQQTFTAESAMERRQKRKLNIARRRQRQKVSYYVPDIPGWEVDNNPTSKSYLNTYLRPAVQKDVPIIAEIYNQWVLHSFIPEDQEEVLEQSFRTLLETAHRESYPFIVAIKGDPPVDRSSTAPEDILGFALAEGCAGFGGGFGGLSRATAFIHVYVDRNCLRKGVGGRLLDQLLKRLSALYVSHFDRHIWVNPDQDPLYEQIPKRFHQILARRPMDGVHDPDIMWFDAFMNKYGFSEAHRTRGIARKPLAMTESNGTGFMEVITYQHEAEFATRVQR